MSAALRAGSNADMPVKPPNILIVMVDQLAPAFLPFHGHKVVKAPHLEALAGNGVVFERAYCASPLCSPSRASFMSGLAPSRTGVYDNAAEFSADIPTFAHHLRLIGYRTILSGKMHFCGPDQLHGFEQRLTTDIYPADYGWTPDWDHPLERPSWYHNMRSVTEAGLCVRTNQLDFDDEVVFAAKRAIFDFARAKEARPFLLVASFTHPHDPFAIPERYWGLYRDADIDMPGPPVPADKLDPHSLRLRRVCAMDAEPVTDQNIRDARRAYYGAISYVDDNLGELVAALRDSGLDRDTIVIFAGDHGEMLGERGLWFKMSFFEGAARVPLLVCAPERYAPRRVAASVSLLDVLPTLVDLAGRDSAALGSTIDGRSLVPQLEGRGGHDEAIGEYLAEGAIAPMVMIRRRAHKFIHSPPDPDQLYDLAADPGERDNLAARPEEAERVADFRREAARRWNLPALEAKVRASQRRRRLVDAALRKGEIHSWDFQPLRDAAKLYVRNAMPLDDIEAMARFPRLAPRRSDAEGGGSAG
jgi:choline-sulfatase